MGDKKFFWPLNIRQKVVVGLTAGLITIGSIAAISYYYLETIDRKQHFMVIAEDLHLLTLELRRYEKNFLLYSSMNDLEENRRYIHEVLEILDKMDPDIKTFKVGPKLEQFRKNMLVYQQLMEAPPHQLGEHDHEKCKIWESQLRDRGKALVDLSQEVLSFERQLILDIITTLKTQLAASMVVFLIVGVFLVLIVSQKIIRPLRVIEQTTRRIARGNFKPLPVLNTQDETQRVVEAFNRMVEELEKRQDMLVQAKKMSSLGVLTAGIAHQLNNPLNNISTSCQIMMEELAPCDRELFHRMLSNVAQEVRRSQDIVKGLLEFSRVRDFSLKPVPLQEVVRQAVRLVSSQVPPGVDIATEVPEDLIVVVDAQRLQEVFLNLLLNAIQAIQEPPGEIKISAGLDPAAQEVVITVTDTGIGIPKEHLDNIFDPFFTTKEIGLGTGLGLSIVYGIIEKHQGHISVESRPGEGTRFTIRLPYERPATEVSAA